jgi:uncharacterized membrane protein YeaQ/YmgE (transglycosylase-associated protein family)
MIPIPWTIVVVFVVVYAVAGLWIGGLSGWLGRRIMKGDSRGFEVDAFLGAFGFLAAYIGCAYMPWPENTVVESLKGGGYVTTTMNRYQHPSRVAVVMAVLLPLLHEIYRYKLTRRVGIRQVS